MSECLQALNFYNQAAKSINYLPKALIFFLCWSAFSDENSLVDFKKGAQKVNVRLCLWRKSENNKVPD